MSWLSGLAATGRSSRCGQRARLRSSAGRRAGSAGSRAARAWSRTGNSSGRAPGRRARCSSGRRHRRPRAHIVAGRQRRRRRARARSRAGRGTSPSDCSATQGIGVSPAQIAVGEIVDHRGAEAALVVEHVVRECRAARRRARASWMSWPGAAGALRADRRAVVVELQRDADDVVARRLQQGGGDRADRRRPTWRRPRGCRRAAVKSGELRAMAETIRPDDATTRQTSPQQSSVVLIVRLVVMAELVVSVADSSVGLVVAALG